MTSTAAAIGAFDTVAVPTIDPYTRTRIERKRLWRKLNAVSQPATPTQMTKYGKMQKTVFNGVLPPSNNLHFSMNPVTLTRENQHLLDPQGFFTAKADGLGGLVVWTTTANTTSDDAPCDTILFITRNNEVRAIHNVPMLADKPAIMDGEMCLCRTRPSNDELERVKSGFNIFNADYMDYFTYLDAQAIQQHGVEYDLACDEHQQQYDHHYELVCAVFDLIFYGGKCTSFMYRDRITMLHELLETIFVRSSVPSRKRLAAIQHSLERIGGFDQIPIHLFLKPVVPMNCVASGLHAVPPSLIGARIDGVVFMSAEQPYECSTFSPAVLKWKPPHMQTVDFTAVRRVIDSTGETVYSLYIMLGNGDLVKATEHVLDDTNVAQRLLAQYSNTQRVLVPSWKTTEEPEKILVLECQPVIAGGQNLSGASARAALQRKLWWRPIEWREEKTRPNSRANYEGVCNALLNPITESDIIAIIQNKQVAGTGAQPQPLQQSETVPIDAPQIEQAALMD